MATTGLHTSLRQTQNTVLAPQLQQSLKVLQAASIELRSTILEELQSNPALEELSMEEASIEEMSAPTEETPDYAEELDFAEREMDILRRMDQDMRDLFFEESARSTFSAEDAERRQHFFDSAVAETSLQEHLLSQAEMTELTPPEREALNVLVSSLDGDGFLTDSLPDIALFSNLPLPAVQRAAGILRNFEPLGIGCENRQQCLLFQLEQKGRGRSLAANILRDHYPLLVRRRIPDLARKLGTDLENVQQAVREIATLEPSPGRRFGEDLNRIIMADARVYQEDGGWKIELNNDYVPRLRISGTYKELLAGGKLSPKERDYLREKIRSGKFLISSIEQRQQTIERITQVLLQFQGGFFEGGVSRLQPLTMNQVALEIGVHETTISRAIANKFIETPHGVFEFRYFFTAGIRTESGETISNRSVKDAIANLVEDENPAKPLSDQDLVEILAEKGFKIARRTVAKYREELGILPTNLRRRY